MPRPGWRRWLIDPVANFGGFKSEATYFWPRWFVLRAVGVIFILAFAGVLSEGMGLVGPNGVLPIGGYLGETAKFFSQRWVALWHAPSVFWLGSSAGAIRCVAGAGLACAIALVVNVAPRWTLLGCWVALLSFVSTWQVLTSTQVDQLALETALLLIPFAPAGLRPGLGLKSPPRPLAVFMVRWLLIRVMLENGIMKFVAGDYHWYDLSAMDVLYETAPFPTILAFWDHQLPHAWHAFEAVLTFVAEIAAPLLAIWGGRRGRWFAFAVWTFFQAGIQLTCNFGWLNTAALVLGVLLLDDQMLAAAWRRIRPSKPLRDFIAVELPPLARWRGVLFAGGLWFHFALAGFAFAAVLKMPEPETRRAEIQNAMAPWHSANAYTLYAALLPWRFSVEFAGSNDGGRTWRPWEFRHQPQREDDISGFFAPWYCRFEATLQAQANSPEPKDIFSAVAAHLVARTPKVIALFERDPFVGAPPPTLVRIRGYRMSFVNLAAHRETGHYWHREETGDFRPMVFRDENGEIRTAKSGSQEMRAMAINGNPAAQAALGFAYARGEGVPTDLAAARRWWERAATNGDADAQVLLGMTYLEGEGVPADHAIAARWLRLAAEQGRVIAQYNLGMLLYRGDGVAVNRREALVWFGVAALAGDEQATRVRDAIARELGPTEALQASHDSRAMMDRIEARAKQSRGSEAK